MGIEPNSQQTLTMNSCNLGTKSSLGLNCYFTAVYIVQKPTPVATLLVPPMLQVSIHTYTCIPSLRTQPRLSYFYPSVRGTKRDRRPGLRVSNPLRQRSSASHWCA